MADNYLTNKPCEFCGQLRRRKSLRYCSADCYQANRKPSSNPAKRFWNFVDKTRSCWLWTGHSNTKGYGRFTFASGAAPVLAHRYAWELSNGPIEEGLSVLHRCDNPSCVNTDHLFLGTKADNNADMVAKGRDRKRGLKGIENHRSKLTEESVRLIRAESAAGVAGNVLAKRFTVGQAAISSIVRRQTWKHVV